MNLNALISTLNSHGFNYFSGNSFKDGTRINFSEGYGGKGRSIEITYFMETPKIEVSAYLDEDQNYPKMASARNFTLPSENLLFPWLHKNLS